MLVRLHRETWPVFAEAEFFCVSHFNWNSLWGDHETEQFKTSTFGATFAAKPAIAGSMFEVPIRSNSWDYHCTAARSPLSTAWHS